MTEETENVVSLENHDKILVGTPPNDVCQTENQQQTSQSSQKLTNVIQVVNIIGTVCIVSQSICTILRSIKSIQSNELQFIDVQTIIISLVISLAEIFVRIIAILQNRSNDKFKSWFTISNGKHIYFAIQILFSFIQGPQAFFPPNMSTRGFRELFDNIYNVFISWFLVAGWIFNTTSYILFVICQVYKKKLQLLKKGGLDINPFQ